MRHERQQGQGECERLMSAANQQTLQILSNPLSIRHANHRRSRHCRPSADGAQIDRRISKGNLHRIRVTSNDGGDAPAANTAMRTSA